MLIRERRDEDLPACVALLRDVFKVTGYPARWPPDPEAWLAGTPHGIAHEAAWVAEIEAGDSADPGDPGANGAEAPGAIGAGTIVGHVAVRRGDHYRVWPAWRAATGLPDERHAVLCRLFVSPEAEARGIGSALMEQAAAHAAAHELQLVLDVVRENTEVAAYYERRGWRRVGEDVLTLENGRPLPLSLYVAHRSDSRRQTLRHSGIQLPSG